MSSSPDPTSAGVLRGAAADGAVKAPFDTNLSRAGARIPRAPSVDAELTAAKEAAKAAGYAAGWAEGKRAAKLEADAARKVVEEETRRFNETRQAALRRALQTVAAAATALEQRAAPSATELEDELVSAAFVLAEAVLGRELALADSPGRDAVARALELVPVGRPVLVRINPADYATLAAEAGHEGPLVIDGRTVALEADASLASGDAIAESDATVVDARLSAALLRVGEALGMVDSAAQPW
ncbi:FliH/SctL family protein [Cryptosporangium aurantiacum]|uniref:Flagellar assembly protein FliH n=1 Tax=Cryptosporangium aurantiacum TaxID=134849 RepID=A0A1M7R6Z0_9ACTN|nr:FliH/SctL family protein [Cryptosporangium aurantiacum]SHN42023.1 flagellar assembly protein FliH [Cryptosporangium aurantiacum]